MPKASPFQQSLLSRRLLVYVVFCVLLLSMITTVAQMMIRHRQSLAAIDASYRFIEDSYVKGIAASVYALDETQLRLQLQGVLNFPNIDYVEVAEKRGDQTILINEGDAHTPRHIVRNFSLKYAPPSKEIASYGILTVAANLDKVYGRMWESGLLAFSTSAVGLGIVGLCIFLIFQFSLTRHLISMCEYTDKLSLNQLDTDYELTRRTPRLWPDDELQQLASALNQMRLRLKKDVMDIRRGEEELRASTKSLHRYEHIISSTEDLMSFVDRHYRYQAVNKAYLKAHARQGEEIVGFPVEALMSSETFHNVVKVQLDRALSGEIVQYQSWFEYAGIGLRYMDVTYHPFKNEAGEIDGVVVSVHDITQQKKAEKERIRLEEQLRQAQKIESIGTLAGGIAHDFNNILAAILGYTELSLDGVEKGSQIESNLQEIFTAGNRARNLVRQILAFARQSEEELKPIQVAAMVEEVLKLIRSSIPTSIEIKQRINSDALVMGNATQVQQVVMNLCSNAAQAMENEGGILDVALCEIIVDQGKQWSAINLKPGAYIELRVADTGVGIDSQIISTIFEPYFTTKGPGEGTGMGLAVANGIIESYGGKITVESKPSEKTIFTVYLPVTRKSPARSSYQSKTLPVGVERILIVDDEAPIANMSGLVLERLGYDVDTKTSSLEALECFRSTPEQYDLVITDMTMPNMTGDVMAAEMIAIRPDIPIIMCSGYSKKISEDTAKEIGIKSFAYKPVVTADLANTVREVLDGNLK